MSDLPPLPPGARAVEGGGVPPLPPGARSADKAGPEPSTTAGGLAASFTRGIAPAVAGAAVGGAIMGGPPGVVAGIIATGGAELFADLVYNHIAPHFGWPEMWSPHEMTDRALDTIGLKRPVTGMEKAAETAGGLASMAAGSPGTLGTAVGKNAEEKAERLIRDAYRRAVRPTASSVGKSRPEVDRYYGHVKSAFDSIIENKANLQYRDAAGKVINEGRVPKTLDETGQAVDQTKSWIARKFDEMAHAAGDKGARVDLTPVVQRLRDIAADPGAQALRKNVADYAGSLADRLQMFGTLTPGQAQGEIAALNADLRGWYKSNVYAPGKTASVDEEVVKVLRSELDKTIESAVAPGYQELKNQWGSLAAIENHIITAGQRVATLDASGGSYNKPANIFAAVSAMEGVIAGDMKGLATAAAIKGGKMAVDLLTHPDRSIKKAFETAEKYHIPRDKIDMPLQQQILSARYQPAGSTTAGSTPPAGQPLPPKQPGTPAPPGGSATPSAPIPTMPQGQQPPFVGGQALPPAAPGVPPNPGGSARPASPLPPVRTLPPQAPRLPFGQGGDFF